MLITRRMESSNRPIVTPAVLRLAAASVLINLGLMAGAFWLTSTNLLAIIVVPLLMAVSIVEIICWRTFAPSRRSEDNEPAPPRMDLVHRLDVRRRTAIIDQTTGLYTRWYFDRRVDEEAARCRRYGHSMAVVVLRVDVVNLTTFSLDGWQQRSLEAAQRAAKVVREVDLSAALSPFEFALCLVHCDRDGATRALDRIIEQLPDYACDAGIAVYPQEGYDSPALIDVASARLRPIETRATA